MNCPDGIITLDGVLHYLNAGYEGEIFRKDQVARQIDNIHEIQTGLQKIVAKWTRLIAFATIVAAVYYFLEICKWVYSLFFC